MMKIMRKWDLLGSFLLISFIIWRILFKLFGTLILEIELEVELNLNFEIILSHYLINLININEFIFSIILGSLLLFNLIIWFIVTNIPIIRKYLKR